MKKFLFIIVWGFLFACGAHAQEEYEVPRAAVTALIGGISSGTFQLNWGAEAEVKHGEMASWILTGTFSYYVTEPYNNGPGITDPEGLKMYLVTLGRRWYRDERFHFEAGLSYVREDSDYDSYTYGIHLGVGKHFPVTESLDIMLKGRLHGIFIAGSHSGGGIGLIPDAHAGLRIRLSQVSK